MFMRKTEFNNATFAQAANFRGAVFTQDAYFRSATFTRDANFRSTTFTQTANFYETRFTQNAYFGGATFTQNAYFGSATFMQDAHFVMATFARDALFGSATFTQDAHFGSATFTQDAHFNSATFTQDAHFGGATFTQDAHFGRATFTQDAHFAWATFTQDAIFGSATFTRNAYFGRATFTQEAIFREAKFLGQAEFRETKFRGHDKNRKEMAREFLPGPVFALAEFSQPEKIIFYKTYLGQALFYNCDVSKVNFSLVVWRRRRGSGKWKVFEEEVDLEAAPDLKPAEGSVDERRYWLVVELYQQLKKNYDARQDYGTGGDFHYGELEMKRLASRRKNKIVRWLVQHLRLVALYKYASQYGESYVRPGVLFVATLLLFALLYPVAGFYDPMKDRAVKSTLPPTVITYKSLVSSGQSATEILKAESALFGNSFLTSVEIAAFQKEPAYQPVYPWGRLLTLVEMLLTSTLAALFFLAVRRQVRR